jgi:hypothetical protein
MSEPWAAAFPILGTFARCRELEPLPVSVFAFRLYW